MAKMTYETKVDGARVRVDVFDVDGDGDPDAVLYVNGLRIGSVDVNKLAGKVKRFVAGAVTRFKAWRKARRKGRVTS